MADQSEALIDYLAKHPTSRSFSPYCHYGAEEDTVVFYFRNEPDYARRINERVTIYLSIESDELVGCQIKGVRRVLEDLGSFDVRIEHGRVKLSLVFLAFLGAVPDDPQTRNIYRQLGSAAAQSSAVLEVPSLG